MIGVSVEVVAELPFETETIKNLDVLDALVEQAAPHDAPSKVIVSLF